MESELANVPFGKRIRLLFWNFFKIALFVVGGGVSENHEKFMPLLDLKTPMIPAKLLNTAGIVGAAYYAAQHSA